MSQKVLLVVSSGSPFAQRGKILRDYLAGTPAEVVEGNPGPGGSVATTLIGHDVERWRPTHVVFCYAGFLDAALAVRNLTVSWNQPPILAVLSSQKDDLKYAVGKGLVAISDTSDHWNDFPNLSEKSEVLKVLALA